MNIKEHIINSLKCDCDHYSDCGYDNWHNFLSDANFEFDKELYDDYLADFSEQELEKIWQKYHS